MTRPIPVLSDYDISPNHGFLPPETPLSVLPDPYYAEWEAIVADLPSLLVAKKLRQEIDQLPVLSTDYLKTPAEWRRASVCLTFMLHAYVFGEKEPRARIPPPLTVPLLSVSAYLELPPIGVYAAVNLWNYRPIDQNLTCSRPEDMEAGCTFTGSLDERWFYQISIAIEGNAASTIPLMLDAIAAARAGDGIKVTECLRTLAKGLQEMIDILKRMPEGCDPHVFYHHLRHFLAGSQSIGGLVYDDGTGKEEDRRAYLGMSNAQSSLVVFFDLVLGISHSRSSKGDKSFFSNMRGYMPGNHRRFLEHIAEIANIRTFVEERSDHRDLLAAYNACLEIMGSMRDVHIRIVARYIMTQSLKNDKNDKNDGQGLCSCDKNTSAPRTESPYIAPEKKTRKGLGGTDLIPFLSRVRTGTRESKMSPLAAGTLKSKNQQMALGASTWLQYILAFAVGVAALFFCKWSTIWDL